MSKKNTPAPGQRTVEYKRAAWKHWSRYFGVFVIVMLNVSLVASTVTRHIQHLPIDLLRELISYVVVLFFDLNALLPIVLEVNSVSITPDYLTLKTLFWKGKLAWQDITSFSNPLWLNWAIVRTAKSIYLINKRDIKPFDEVLEIIQFKLGKLVK